MSTSTIHTLIDDIHVQVNKAAKQRKRTLVNTFYAASAKILRLWWTLTMIKSLRSQICSLQIQVHEGNCKNLHPALIKELNAKILALETRITQLINKAI